MAKTEKPKAELLPHHAAWLSAHPNRSPEWLRQRTSDGFDIHHLDGEHENNDPDNLVLIESLDHARLHGNERFTRIPLGPRPERTKSRKDRIALITYQMLARGEQYREIEIEVGCTIITAISHAKSLAKQNGWYWPERINRAPKPWPALPTLPTPDPEM